MNAVNHDQWMETLRHVLRREYGGLPVNVGRDAEPAQVAISLYRELSDSAARDVFADAITTLFESTAPRQGNVDTLFNLLHIIAYVAPPKAKRLVRRRVSDESLSHLHYPPGMPPLSLLCLAVAGKYDVDDDLVDYIHVLNSSAIDFAFRLVSLRLLATRSGKEVADLLDQTITAARNPLEIGQLVTELKPILVRRKCHFFFHWCLSQLPQRAHARSQYEWFIQELKTSTFPRYRLHQVEPDTYASLVTAYLHLGHMTAADIVQISRQSLGKASQIVHDTNIILGKTSYNIIDPSDPNIKRMATITEAMVTSYGSHVTLDPVTDANILIRLYGALGVIPPTTAI